MDLIPKENLTKGAMKSPQIIYRHAIPGVGIEFEVPMNRHAQVVYIGLKGEKFGDADPHFWIKTDRSWPVQSVTFKVIPTGKEWDEADWCYEGTFTTGSFVWHLLKKVGA